MSVADLIGFGRDIGTRFALVGLLPGGVLALFVLALVWSGAPGDAPDLDRVLDHARDLDAWAGALLFLALVVAALVLQPLQLGLVRALEGYWPARVRGRSACAASSARYDALAAAAAPRAAPHAAHAGRARGDGRRREPAAPPVPADPAWLLPTRLGNALRAAETRAGEPYGLDAVVAWPRLYPLLPDGVRALVDDQRDGLDLAARFCAVFAAAAASRSSCSRRTAGGCSCRPAACVLAWLVLPRRGRGRGRLRRGHPRGDRPAPLRPPRPRCTSRCPRRSSRSARSTSS